MIERVKIIRSPWQIIILLVVSAFLGLVIGHYGLFGAGAIALLIGGVICIIRPDWLFYFCLATIVVGQLVRLPLLGGDSGVLLNDILLPVLIVVWTWKKLGTGSWKIPHTSLWWPIMAFVGVIGLSIVVNRTWYAGSEMLSGAMYAVRWIEYAFLLLITADLASQTKDAWRLVKMIVWTGLILSVLGFIQLRLFPDFSFMAPQGWDPHVGRLLSTWFDPNFLAGYLAALATITLSIALSRRSRGGWWWAATAVMALAVLLTYSRSGYIALAIGFGLVAFVRSRLMLWIGALMLVGAILFVPRIQERVIGIRTIDETAQFRLVSWSNALTVINDQPWLGVGYNFYRYTQVRYGFIEDIKAHSASGSDSSILTVTVTTGIIGLIIYLWLYFSLLRETILTTRQKELSEDWRAYGLGLTAALIALFFHAQFVNSLFYPHLMQFIWMAVGLAVAVRQENKS